FSEGLKAKRLVDYRESNVLQRTPTRYGFGDGLVEAGRRDPNVVAVCADLTESTRMQAFSEAFPDRFIEIGVQEQLLAAMSAGLAMAGKVPFIASYAMFCPGRAWEQVRTNICLNDANVKIAGAHAGVSVGPDGATHQAIEDIAILRPIPNITIVVPCDAPQTKKATLAVAAVQGPAYVRFGRDASPVLTTDETPFELGKAQVFRDGHDVAIIACGILVYNALMAAERLAREDHIECLVLNNHTVKPMDERAVVEAARRCGAVVTVEEHEVLGGMGSRVAEILAARQPAPMEFIGVQNRFGQSGTPQELIEEYGMGIGSIYTAVKRVVSRKHEGG
ncbi:MAG: transketolase family protein, partial [Chloroflexota bacterium]